jgi:two-component system secretion response regulator SsrB
MKNILTRRQKTVLDLCCSGKCSKEIAVILFIQVKTVNKHKSNILDRYNAVNMVQVAFLYGKSSE